MLGYDPSSPLRGVAIDLVKDIDKTFFFPKPEPPETLYHYTSIEGFYGILQSGEFWLSDVSFLNDFSEMKYAYTLLSNISRSFKDSTLSIDRKQIWTKVFGNGFSRPTAENVFVMSFCEKDDLLSQWTTYNAAVSIGFESQQLITHLSDAQSRRIHPIEYVESKQAKKLTTVFDKVTGFIESCPFDLDIFPTDDILLEHSLRNCAIHLDKCASFIKNPHFCHEKEWRLTEWFRERPDTILYRPRGVERLPYWRLRINPPPTSFIKEVIISPLEPIREEDVQRALHAINLNNVKIKHSAIPYRI